MKKMIFLVIFSVIPIFLIGCAEDKSQFKLVFKQSMITEKSEDILTGIKEGRYTYITSKWDTAVSRSPEVIGKDVLLELCKKDFKKIIAMEQYPYHFDITIYLNNEKSKEVVQVLNSNIRKRIAIFFNEDLIAGIPISNEFKFDKDGYLPIVIGGGWSKVRFNNSKEMREFLDYYKLKATFREMTQKERDEGIRKMENKIATIKNEEEKKFISELLEEIKKSKNSYDASNVN